MSIYSINITSILNTRPKTTLSLFRPARLFLRIVQFGEHISTNSTTYSFYLFYHFTLKHLFISFVVIVVAKFCSLNKQKIRTKFLFKTNTIEHKVE